jgi:type II secretory pathway pseudopilin PulG
VPEDTPFGLAEQLSGGLAKQEAEVQSRRIEENPTLISGFTVTELLVTVACVLLLAAVLLPAMAKFKARSSRIGCNGNMKQVGLAFLSWSMDNQGRFPMRVSSADGGTMELVGNGTVFPHFQVLSNELATPRLLRCPTDAKKTMATSFAVGFSDNNLSYFLGVDSARENGSSLLAGDRNLTIGPIPASALLSVTTNLILGWGKDLHSAKANVCFGDGMAMQVQNGFVAAGTNRLAIP